MIEKEKIVRLVEEKLDENQFIVEVSVSTANVIHVAVDGMDGITIEQCVAISRNIEGNLDRESEDFELQVASAGLGMPFLVHKQYVKNEGKEIEVLTAEGIKMSGILKNVQEESFDLEVTRKEKVEGSNKKQMVTKIHHFAFSEIKEAKYIIKF